MPRCLSQLDLSYDMQKLTIADNTDDNKPFMTIILCRGINRKAWCKNLASFSRKKTEVE